jgi:hypothetical protein
MTFFAKVNRLYLNAMTGSFASRKLILAIQPLVPANVKASAAQPAAVQSGTLAAAIRAAVPGAAITSTTAIKPKKRVRVWEPSSLEIQQQDPNPRPHPHST